MNLHSRAKSCPSSRALFVQRVHSGMSVLLASAMAGFSERTGHKWLKRFKEEGHTGLRDRSSQPHRLERSHELGLVVEAVGRRRRGQAAVRIAAELGVPRSTVGFWLRKAGTSQPSALREKEPPNRYEHEAPGDLLHLDTKKLANFSEVGHRANGIRHRRNRGQGYQVLHVCSDDHSRVAYMEMLPDEKKETTAAFLRRALLHFQAQGITIRKLLTDNGSPYRSNAFKAMREALGSSTAEPGLTARERMARLSALSRPPSASGPTAPPGRLQMNETRPSKPGSTSTITTGPIRPSTVSPPSQG